MQISLFTKAATLGGAAVAALAFSVAPASAAASISATPTTGLASGQSVTVSGAGYAAGTQVAVSQCADGNKCTDVLSTATVAANGTFSTSYTVQKTFSATDWSTGSTVTVNCAVQQCQLVAYTEATGAVGTNISFG
ncbi:enediyne antibiotic chromoprotein [Streptomyces sp. NPDC003327]